MYINDEKEGEQKVSKFSSGISQLMRLDVLWRDTHRHSRHGMFSAWNMDLDRVWCELARDLDDDEIIDKKGKIKKGEYKKYKQEYDSFDDKLIKTGKFKDNQPEGFKDYEENDLKLRDQQYKILIEKELFLRRLENHLGKGTTWDEGDDLDFD